MSNLANEEFSNLTMGSKTDPEDIFEILNSTTDLSKHWMKEIFNEISIMNNKISEDDHEKTKERWRILQDFFDKDRYDKIKEWMKPERTDLFAYRPRRNNCT